MQHPPPVEGASPRPPIARRLNPMRVVTLKFAAPRLIEIMYFQCMRSRRSMEISAFFRPTHRSANSNLILAR